MNDPTAIPIVPFKKGAGAAGREQRAGASASGGQWEESSVNAS
jgi:hypothetical protein